MFRFDGMIESSQKLTKNHFEKEKSWECVKINKYTSQNKSNAFGIHEMLNDNGKKLFSLISYKQHTYHHNVCLPQYHFKNYLFLLCTYKFSFTLIMFAPNILWLF